jgi:agmatine deiminase
MPAEWEPHAATWLAWPHNAEDWPGKLEAITWVFCELMRQLTRGERVRLIVARRSDEKEVRKRLEQVRIDLRQVDFVVAPTNRSWVRDSLPQFIVTGGGKTNGSRSRVSKPASKRIAELGAVKFRFNAWARYDDHPLDDKAGEKVAKGWAEKVWLPSASGRRIVLEGGAIDVDGEGTLLTTERCLLGSPYTRNPGLDSKAVEGFLGDYLGIEKVIWLPDGIAGDDTSGHIDDLARFVGDAKVVLIQESNKRDENRRVLDACRARLQGARDARGRKIEMIPLPMPAPVFFGADRLPASYANFYIANEVVLVPTFNDANDRIALGILAELFPKHRVVGIHARDLVLGLGTIHCSTQQEPLIGA